MGSYKQWQFFFELLHNSQDPILKLDTKVFSVTVSEYPSQILNLFPELGSIRFLNFISPELIHELTKSFHTDIHNIPLEKCIHTL